MVSGGDNQVQLPQGRPGQSVQERGEERAVGWREAGFVDLALEDGELVAEGKTLTAVMYRIAWPASSTTSPTF
jgi:hypothetical protein